MKVKRKAIPFTQLPRGYEETGTLKIPADELPKGHSMRIAKIQRREFDYDVPGIKIAKGRVPDRYARRAGLEP